MTPPNQTPQFEVTAEDRDFVSRASAMIPLEHADKEKLGVLIAGYRMMHASRSPNAEMKNHLATAIMSNRSYYRMIWELVRQSGGEVTLDDASIPVDVVLELSHVGERKLLIKSLPPGTPESNNDGSQN